MRTAGSERVTRAAWGMLKNANQVKDEHLIGLRFIFRI